MRLSDRGLHLITSFEGFPNQGRPYNDPVGFSTVGYGHLIARRAVNDFDRRSVWVHGQHRPGILTPAEGMQLLRHDLVDYENSVDRLVTRRMTQGEFDALVSFTYNLGPGALATSTLLRLFNGGNVAGAANEFLKWDRAGGAVLAGLVRRREAERELFLAATTDPFVGYTADEVRWIEEYDAIVHNGGSPARRRQLVHAMTADRKRIWQAARRDGWDLHHRKQRYHSLLARSR